MIGPFRPTRVAGWLALAAGGWMLFPAAEAVRADFDDLMGYPALLAELGDGVPTGDGVEVTQVEAPQGTDPNKYMPDTTIPPFGNHTITDESGGGSNSTHATRVGLILYSERESIATQIRRVRVYEVNDFLSNFLRSDRNLLPPTTDSRLANHSWVGSTGSNAADRRILERADFLVEEDDYLQITGVTPDNESPSASLMADAYNDISVGLTDGRIHTGTQGLGSIYTAGRVAPTVVTPGFRQDDKELAVSWAVAQVSAGAALMLETARDPALSQGSITNRTRTIQHAESSEVIKAIMMAGADRFVDNVRGPDLLDFQAETANNLSETYGAGQMNVYHNHRILTGGEQDSIEDGGTGQISAFGWDYDPAFGGLNGSNDTATYSFTAAADQTTLFASLVWNANIDIQTVPGGQFRTPEVTAEVVDLNLELRHVTSDTVVADSTSTTENTENIHFTDLTPGESYELRVIGNEGGDFLWDYALAWRIVPEIFQVLRGDMNADGVIDEADIDPFLLALTDMEAFKATFGGHGETAGDVNRDGVFNNFDIRPFVDLLPAETLADTALASMVATAVPEPGTLGLFALGGALGLTRRSASRIR